MKKCISVLVLLVLVTVGAFAQFSLSIGGGLFFDGGFQNFIEGNTPEPNSVSLTMGYETLAFGGYVFF